MAIFSIRRRLQGLSRDYAGNPREFMFSLFRDENSYALALLQFADMGKDFLDSFRKYRSNANIDRKHDAAMLGFGLGNILWAPFKIAGTVIKLAAVALRAVTYDLFKNGPWTSIKNLAKGIFNAVGGVLYAAAGLIRGATQIAAAPLTFLFRMPIRAIRSRKGNQKFHENPGVVRLFKASEKALHDRNRLDTRNILLLLDEKIKTAAAIQQPAYARGVLEQYVNETTNNINNKFSVFNNQNLNESLTDDEIAETKTFLNSLRPAAPAA